MIEPPPIAVFSDGWPVPCGKRSIRISPQETLVMEALQAGARDFIVKPFKPDSVIATLSKVLEKES